MGEFFGKICTWCKDHSKGIATAASIGIGLFTAAAGIANAHNNSKQINAQVNEAVTREIDRRLPPVTQFAKSRVRDRKVSYLLHFQKRGLIMVQESKDTYFEKGECWCCNGESDWGKLIAVKLSLIHI